MRLSATDELANLYRGITKNPREFILSDYEVASSWNSVISCIPSCGEFVVSGSTDLVNALVSLLIDEVVYHNNSVFFDAACAYITGCEVFNLNFDEGKSIEGVMFPLIERVPRNEWAWNLSYTHGDLISLKSLYVVTHGKIENLYDFWICHYGDSYNPYGRGIGIPLYQPIKAKTLLFKTLPVASRNAAGFPSIRKGSSIHPNLASTSSSSGRIDMQKVSEEFSAMYSSFGLMKIPDGYVVEDLSLKSEGSFYQTSFNLWDNAIRKLVMGSTLSSDADGKGSYSLGEIHNRRLNERASALGEKIAIMLNDLSERFCNFNFAEGIEVPKVEFKPKENTDESTRNSSTSDESPEFAGRKTPSGSAA